MTTTDAVRRTWRSLLKHRVTASFGAIVVVSFAVVTVIAYAVNSNHTLIVRVAKLQKEQTAQRVERAKQRDAEIARAAASDLKLCNTVEGLKAVIRGVVVPTRDELLKTSYYKTHPAEIPSAIQQGKKVAKQFAASDCTKLPSQTAPPSAAK